MKKIKIIIAVSVISVVSILGTLIGLSIWVNRPRGVRIDL